MTSLYSTLDNPKGQIRLIQIDTEALVRNNQIVYKLIVVTLPDAPPFCAISYVWGDPAVTEETSVNNQKKAVTKNLAAALRGAPGAFHKIYKAGRSLQSLYFWADALCINQDNTEEKNSQVQLMSAIFGQAEMVIAWLGESSRQIYLALESFYMIFEESRKLSNDEFCSLQWLARYPSLYEDDIGTTPDNDRPSNERWNAMGALFDLPYWKRVWILQENALAKQLLFCTHECSLFFEIMALAVSGMHQIRRSIEKGLTARPEFMQNSSVWLKIQGNFKAFDEVERIHNARDLTRRFRSESCQPKLKDMEEAWISPLRLRRLLATDPRDHIYGFLGVSNLPLLANYAKDKLPQDVYCEYLEALLHFYQTHRDDLLHRELHFLEYAGIGHPDFTSSIPTWARDFAAASKSESPDHSFVGNADQHVFPKHTERATIRNSRLIVPGLAVDYIASIEPPHEIETRWEDSTFIFLKKFVARNATYRNGQSRLLTILRTLKFDSEGKINENVAGDAYSFVDFVLAKNPGNGLKYLAALGIVPVDGETDTLKLGDLFFDACFPGAPRPLQAETSPQIQAQHEGSPLVHYLVLVAKRRYRFFETSQGFFGLCPFGSEVGDEIFVLHGAGVPMVLRQRGSYFALVGSCFIVDLMDGEAASHIQSGKAAIKTVVLE